MTSRWLAVLLAEISAPQTFHSSEVRVDGIIIIKQELGQLSSTTEASGMMVPAD